MKIVNTVLKRTVIPAGLRLDKASDFQHGESAEKGARFAGRSGFRPNRLRDFLGRHGPSHGSEHKPFQLAELRGLRAGAMPVRAAVFCFFGLLRMLSLSKRSGVPSSLSVCAGDFPVALPAGRLRERESLSVNILCGYRSSYSSKMSAAQVTSFAPSRIRVLVPSARGSSGFPGRQTDRAPAFSRHAR